jgi:SAM-dependent methyltransferase
LSPGAFRLTDIGTELVSDDERSQWFRGWLDLDGPGSRMDLAFSGMLYSIRTGRPAYESMHGRSFWVDIEVNPALSEFFHGVMAAYTWQTAPLLVKEYDWSSVRRVVDVGGGAGALLAQLLRAHRHLHGILVDLPAAAPAAEWAFAEAGLADRATVVDGTFFTTLPTGADVYLVSRLLSGWNDERATAILRRCAEAAAPNGVVLIVEVLSGAEHAGNNSSFDLHRLVLLGGRERTVADFESIADDAGLAAGWSRTGEGGLTLIECRPVR